MEDKKYYRDKIKYTDNTGRSRKQQKCYPQFG